MNGSTIGGTTDYPYLIHWKADKNLGLLGCRNREGEVIVVSPPDFHFNMETGV